MTARAWTLLLALSCVWGGSFLFVGIAVREWPPLPIVLARVALVLPFLWALVWWLRLPVRRDGAALRAHLGMGVLNNLLPFTLMVTAQGALPSGVAAILNATTPFWGVLLAHLAGAERATAARVLGVALGFGGVAAMVGADPFAAPLHPVALMLLGTLSYALAGLWGRRLRGLGIPPMVAATGQLSASALLLAPMVLLGAWPPLPGPATVAALLALSLLCSGLAYWLYFALLEAAGPVNLLLVTLIIPGFAAVLGWAVLGEALGWPHALGMALIALGFAVMDGRLLRRRAR
ncbi:DMT family transporter [Roseococcus sp. DSY-14]|uniref:DMT family transporter n=1 Tax=Roseococcus sp. DSY-14 TaxID=3369650 RepID=UPI00387A870B